MPTGKERRWRRSTSSPPSACSSSGAPTKPWPTNPSTASQPSVQPLPPPARSPRLPSPPPALPVAAPPSSAAAIAAAAHDLPSLHAAMDAFEGCALRHTASSTVAPSGNPAATLLVRHRSPKPRRRSFRPQLERRLGRARRPHPRQRRAQPRTTPVHPPHTMAASRRTPGQRGRDRCLPAVLSSPARPRAASANGLDGRRPVQDIERRRRQLPPRPRHLENRPATRPSAASRLAHARTGGMALDRRQQAGPCGPIC